CSKSRSDRSAERRATELWSSTLPLSCDRSLPAYTTAAKMSPARVGSLEARCGILHKTSRKRNPADLGDVAADLAEVLEHDAEQHRHPGGDVAVADPRLAHRADKGHAFVLVDRRQRSTEAGVRRRRRRDAVDDRRAAGQVDRLGRLQRPIMRELRGHTEVQLVALAVQDVLTGGRVCHDLALQLRRKVDIRAGDAQARWSGAHADLL